VRAERNAPRAPDPWNAITVGECTRFLKRELEVLPKEWPVLAVGKFALKWCTENAAGRTVVGVPHSSGNAFEFLSLFPPKHLDPQRLEWVHGKWHWPTGQ
jgi:uracil-DNA glycosylase